MFAILTTVDYVCVNYNKPNQKRLDVIIVNEFKQYIKENRLYQKVCCLKLN